jgi:hypothetical protein
MTGTRHPEFLNRSAGGFRLKRPSGFFLCLVCYCYLSLPRGQGTGHDRAQWAKKGTGGSESMRRSQTAVQAEPISFRGEFRFPPFGPLAIPSSERHGFALLCRSRLSRAFRTFASLYPPLEALSFGSLKRPLRGACICQFLFDLPHGCFSNYEAWRVRFRGFGGLFSLNSLIGRRSESDSKYKPSSLLWCLPCHF